MLGAVRKHGRANLSMKQHKWEKKTLHGTELYGKTLGLIGGGRIGLAVAERAIAFGMTVLAYDVVPIKTELAVTPGPAGRAPGQGRPHHPAYPQDPGPHPRPGRVRQDEGRASSSSTPPAAASWTRRPSSTALQLRQGPGRGPGRLRQGAARGLVAHRPSERHRRPPHRRPGRGRPEEGRSRSRPDPQGKPGLSRAVFRRRRPTERPSSPRGATAAVFFVAPGKLANADNPIGIVFLTGIRLK